MTAQHSECHKQKLAWEALRDQRWLMSSASGGGQVRKVSQVTCGAVGENEPSLTGTQGGRRASRWAGLGTYLGDGEQFCGPGEGVEGAVEAEEAE